MHDVNKSELTGSIRLGRFQIDSRDIHAQRLTLQTREAYPDTFPMAIFRQA